MSSGATARDGGPSTEPEDVVVLLRLLRRTEIIFRHVSLEAFVVTFDTVRTNDSLMLGGHLPDNGIETCSASGRLVLHGLTDREHEVHSVFFLRCVAYQDNILGAQPVPFACEGRSCTRTSSVFARVQC